ncbi:hypothetical protein [Consotaella salsifontis]|uniref:hypothetical protein n=1 Tax=Consotaella salsifontis TaxID=1365950 RepID=UPI0010545896|nr:hypothetical protein [Consotaella salsifontis]
MTRHLACAVACLQERGNQDADGAVVANKTLVEDKAMGRGILLWLLGIPIPIIILILLFWH